MTSTAVIEAISRIAVVPVVVIDDAAHAGDLARTLRDNGIATAEVTLRTPAALDAISAMASIEGFLVGAGTVVSPLDVAAAVDAGARFLVSPGLEEVCLQRAAERGIPFVPGVATATEVQRAHTAGLSYVKLFPAGVLGGRALIDALSAPFPRMRFLPSGGVDANNLTDYLASPAVFAVSGSWMVPRTAIAARDLALVARRTAETARRVASTASFEG
jgi:2-dehydro-3-deoxyphosphogluconate aldolase/(4S)-4-hydroxy-2-oxoglutarate aldolase